MEKEKNKNYYDWLEISKNASPEVIEKAYKALVKKYHPDLQEGENKAKAEEIIKKINEAYAVLSDETKRKQYDETIKDDTISKEAYDKLQQELNNIKRQSSEMNNSYVDNQHANYQNTNQAIHNTNFEASENLNNQNQNIDYQQQLENARRKAYHDAYVQELRRRGYKIRYKKTFKDYLKIFIAIVVVILICVLLWVIPFTREKLISFYNSNEMVKYMIDFIIKIVKSIFHIE